MIDLKAFIDDNRSLINNKDFNKVFENIRYTDAASTLIQLLMQHNINPLEEAFKKDSKANYLLLNIYLKTYHTDKFVLPANVTEIEPRSFDGVSIKSLDFSESAVETLQTNTVRFNPSLEEIWLPNNLKKIESNAIDGPNNLRQIIFPDSCEVIMSRAFSNCNRVKKVYLPNSLKKFNTSSVVGHAMTPPKLEYIYDGPDWLMKQRVEMDNQRRAGLSKKTV